MPILFKLEKFNVIAPAKTRYDVLFLLYYDNKQKEKKTEKNRLIII